MSKDFKQLYDVLKARADKHKRGISALDARRGLPAVNLAVIVHPA